MLGPNPDVDTERKRVTAPLVSGARTPGSSSRCASAGRRSASSPCPPDVQGHQHHPRPGQHRRGDPLLGQAGDPGCGRPHGDQPVHDHVGPAGLPAVQHHRRHRQDRHQGPLLRGRHLHGVPDRDQCAEEGPGRRVLRRQAGQLRGRRRQGRPGRLRHLRALHLRERGPAVEQAGEVRAGERGRLPVLPQALSIRAADKQKLAPAWRSWSRSSSAPRSTSWPTRQDQRADRRPGQAVQHRLGLLGRPGRLRHRRCARTSSPTGPTRPSATSTPPGCSG